MRKCDCESTSCAAKNGHPVAGCHKQATVKTTHNTVCADCAANYPEEYLVGAITISQLADHILGREAKTGEDFAEAKLAMLGGCEQCGASIACYNAYPSKSGNWRCQDCIGDDGFETVEYARYCIFPDPEQPANLLETMPVLESSTFEFDTTVERDQFIDKTFPQRECQDTPGCYSLPSGGSLAVCGNRVTVFESGACCTFHAAGGRLSLSCGGDVPRESQKTASGVARD